MALKSFIKSHSDRLCYFSNWRFNFQKTRVIGSLRHLDEALERFVASPFLVRFNYENFFYQDTGLPEINHRWHLFYEEALFLNYVVKNWQFDKTKLSKYELQDYEEAEAKLQKWNDVRVFSRQIEEFLKEIRRTIYIRRASAYPNNFFTRHFPEIEMNIIGRYHLLMEQLKDYPEWAERVKLEVEPVIKQLADVCPVDTAHSPVNFFFGIDLQSYFR